MRLMLAYLPSRRNQALGNQVLGEPQLIEHFQSGWMKSRSSEVIADLAFLINDQGFNTGQRQPQPRHQANGARTTNKNRHLLH